MHLAFCGEFWASAAACGDKKPVFLLTGANAVTKTPYLYSITQKHYTMNPRAAAMPASVGLKDSSSSSCVNSDTSVDPGRDLMA